MQLWYNGYAFPANAVACTTATRGVPSRSGRIIRRIGTIVCSGTLFGAGQAALTLAEQALRTALNQNYQSLILKMDNGANSSVNLINNSTLSGVRITDGPNFGEATGGEFARIRRFVFTAEAEWVTPDGVGALVSYQETVSVTGNGGPVRRWRVPVNAAPIRQITSPYSIVRYQHSGVAVGHTSRPEPPEPFFGRAILVNEAESVSYDHPEPMGLSFINWPVRWNYQGEKGIGSNAVLRNRLPLF